MRQVALTLFALVVLLATAATALLPPKASGLSAAYTYEMYLEDHHKKAAKPVEYAMRKAQFEKNLREVLRHNANPMKTYTKGINRFSDWTDAEFKATLGARHEPTFKSKRAGLEKPFMKSELTEIKSNLDWRNAFPNVLSAVKDQGMCGDCWAHAVTETIESAYARATGQLLVLSQQQITSCTPKTGTCYGCQGMYPRYAYEFASDAATIMEEWVYPFTSYTGQNAVCNNMTNPSYPLNNFATMWSYTQIAPNNVEDVIAALNQGGPLSVLVDASAWSHYESGVFDGCTYDKNFQLDHAVQLVGYGYDDVLNQDYWIVRNSWSAGWGEHGYIRLQKQVNTTCGLNYGGMSCYTSGNQTQPTQSCGMCGILTDAQFPNVGIPQL